MRFAVTDGERTVEELVERLYRTESKSAAGRAKRGLRDLNPQLKEIAETAAGTAILVPDVDGAEPVGEEEVSSAQAIATAVTDDFSAALNAALDQLESSIAEERDDTRHTIKRLRSSELRAAAKEVPDALAQLKDTLAGAEERLEEVEALELYRRQVLVPEAEGLSELKVAGASRRSED
jgi:predicted  nucleic acid-binding Zn-ribbon protein